MHQNNLAVPAVSAASEPDACARAKALARRRLERLVRAQARPAPSITWRASRSIPPVSLDDAVAAMILPRAMSGCVVETRELASAS